MGDERFVRRLKTPNWTTFLESDDWNSTKKDIIQRNRTRRILPALGFEIRQNKKSLWPCKPRKRQILDVLHFVRINHVMNTDRGIDVTSDGYMVGLHAKQNALSVSSIFQSPINISKSFETSKQGSYLALKAHPKHSSLVAISVRSPSKIQVVNIRTRKVEETTFSFSDFGPAITIDWSPADDKRLIWGTTLGYIMSVAGERGVVVKAYLYEVTDVKYSPSGAYIASLGGLECVIKIWSGYKFQLVHTLPGGNAGVMAWHPRTPNFLATTTTDANIKLWKLYQDEPLIAEKEMNIRDHIITAITFNPKTAELYVVSQTLAEDDSVVTDSSDSDDAESRFAHIHVLDGQGSITDCSRISSGGEVSQLVWNCDATILGVLGPKRITLVKTNRPTVARIGYKRRSMDLFSSITTTLR